MTEHTTESTAGTPAGYKGRLTSFDPTLRVGMIMPVGSTRGLVFSQDNVVGCRGPINRMLGQEVTFELVASPQGPVPVNVKIKPLPLLRPGETMAALSAPLLTAVATAAAVYVAGWPALNSYLLTINLITFAFILLKAGRPWGYNLQLTDYVVFFMALAGAAPIAVLTASLVPSRLRIEPARIFLIAVSVAQLYFLYNFHPEIFTNESWAPILHG